MSKRGFVAEFFVRLGQALGLLFVGGAILVWMANNFVFDTTKPRGSASKQEPTLARLDAAVQVGVEQFKRFEAAAGRGEVLVGMTSDQAMRAWPWPDHMSKTTTASGTSEMWVYGKRGDRTVFIENGVVRAIRRSN